MNQVSWGTSHNLHHRVGDAEVGFVRNAQVQGVLVGEKKAEFRSNFEGFQRLPQNGYLASLHTKPPHTDYSIQRDLPQAPPFQKRGSDPSLTLFFFSLFNCFPPPWNGGKIRPILGQLTVFRPFKHLVGRAHENLTTWL